MRRLKSTYTLHSDESSPPREEVASAYENGGQRQIQQFSWPQILSPDFTSASSDMPDVSYFIDNNASGEPSQQQYNVQNPLEHQHHLLGYDIWKNDAGLFSEPSMLDIASVDSESCYGTPSQFNETVQPDPLQPYPMVTTYGSVSLMLRHLVRVDINPEGSVLVQNIPGQFAAVINSAGDKSYIIHLNSRVYQDGQNVHMWTCQNRMVKICQRGIVFSSSTRSLAYLVDESGTKSTADRFMDLFKRDYTMDVFYDQQEQIGHSLERCYEMIANATHKSYQNGDDVWIIGGTQIKQDRYGNIEVSQHFRRRVITVLPTLGEMTVLTSIVRLNVCCYSKRYMSVQMGNKRIMSGFCGLTVQNGSQKAGLDRNGKVVIF